MAVTVPARRNAAGEVSIAATIPLDPAGKTLPVGGTDNENGTSSLDVNITGGGGSGGAVPVTQGVGAANLATSQVTTATSQVALAIARPTRTSVVFQNLDAAITIYVGPTGITSSTGYPILAGQARVFTWVGEFFAVSASGTPVMAVSDEYN